MDLGGAALSSNRLHIPRRLLPQPLSPLAASLVLHPGTDRGSLEGVYLSLPAAPCHDPGAPIRCPILWMRSWRPGSCQPGPDPPSPTLGADSDGLPAAPPPLDAHWNVSLGTGVHICTVLLLRVRSLSQSWDLPHSCSGQHDQGYPAGSEQGFQHPEACPVTWQDRDICWSAAITVLCHPQTHAGSQSCPQQPTEHTCISHVLSGSPGPSSPVAVTLH